MARLIPPFISDECRSGAERRLFDRFRVELPDDFTVLHSLGVARHRYKLYSEADFVLVHRDAVIVFEVKGGRVARKEGSWFFTDRYGQIHKRHESPMQQAASVAAAIRNSVRGEFGPTSPQSRVTFGSVAFFPDIEFSETSPDWDIRRVYDINAWRRPLGEVVADAVAYSRAEMARVTQHTPATLTAAESEQLVDYLRGDFEKIPSLSVSIDGHEDLMVRLAPSQYALLDSLTKNRRMVIEGGAGTGKTLLAMEAARRHAERGRRVLFVCFNRLLADHLKAYAIRGRFPSSIDIGTLHSHCVAILGAAGFRLPNETVSSEVFSAEIPGRVSEAIGKIPGFKPWDVLVVDEGQDLAAHAPFVSAIGQMLEGGFRGGNWIWFEDPRQRIIRQGDALPFELAGHEPSYFTLTKNWRNTNEVATYTSVATTFPLPELSGIEGPKVGTVICNGDELAQLGRIVSDLLAKGARPDQIVLLSAVAESKAVFSSQAVLCGVPLRRFDSRETADNKSIRFSSVFRFKGLEAKIVILTDVHDLSDPLSRMAAYVGMSRANSVLAVLLTKNAHVHFEANRLAAGGGK